MTCQDASKATKETMSFDEWLEALRFWVESNPQIYCREFVHEIQTQPKTDMEGYYQDGLSVQAVALGISMNLL